MVITDYFRQFFKSEKAGGLTLVACTIISLLIANSRWSVAYINVLSLPIAGHSLTHWINDGLMAIFFLLIGLELKREVQTGELSTVQRALLPGVAAIGGMLIPAALYFFINSKGEGQSGVGIPMATDIAFAIGVLSLLGDRVPVALRVFLTALAVIDDLGAILVIAFAYAGGIDSLSLMLALGIFVLLLILNKLKVRLGIIYLALGIAMWYFLLQSGVHATLAGVLLAITIPSSHQKNKTSIAGQWQNWLHYPVAFIILPLFALANTALFIPNGWMRELGSGVSIGIIVGLVLGKPIGICLISWVAVRMGWAKLPDEISWSHILGAGMLAGIGFTMSIFITLLAFKDQHLIDVGKIAILIASTISAVAGYCYLAVIRKSHRKSKEG